MQRWLTRRGLTRTVFDALLVVQLGHLGEHLMQVAQIYLLGWPPPQARGLIASFDVETMHFVWNVAVLATVGWLLRRGVCSTALVLTFVWATAHTVEHGYLVTHAMLTGRDGSPGLLGGGGLLERLGVAVPALTTWTRPTVHLVWNAGEVALLVLAYGAFAWPWLPRSSRRALTLTPGAVATALAVLVLAFSATRADQPMTALAPFDVIVDGRNELVGVAVAADDALYVSDRGAGIVYRLTATGALTIVAANLDRPAGLAVTADGRLLIVEEHAGRLLRLERDGSLTVVASGLKTPRWIVVNDDDTLYVTAHRLTSPDGADRSEARVVVRVDVAAGTMAEVTTGIRSAQGLARVNGSLIVASKGLADGPESAGVLLRYPVLADGAVGGAEAWAGAGLKQPVGLAVDALASVYVASKELTVETDRSNRAIGKVHSGARLTDFTANLGDPQGVALGHDGALYVADGKSGRLYRFRAPPAPTLGALPQVTRQPSLAVTGTTEARSKVDVFVDHATNATSGLADTTGHFALGVALSPNRFHSLHVYATTHDGDGLTSPAATAQIVHDDQPPNVVLSAPPAAMHVRRAVQVSSVARDDGSGVASVTLRAAGQPLSPALHSAPPAATVTASAIWDTTRVTDGAQTLFVKATDVAGNESTGVTSSVIVDNTAPETTITSGPEGDVAITGATFTFTGSDAIAATVDLTFSWRLDSGAWSGFAGATGVTLIDLADGEHVFEVKARDRAGNEDLTPARRAWRVVLRPVITAIVPPSAVAGTFVTLSGHGFSPAPVTVTFNGVPAVVRTATVDAITTTVPIGATSGPVVVATPRGATSAAFTVGTTGDFGFSALPAIAASVPGAQVSYALSVVGSGAFTGLVSVSVSGLPAGVSAEFLPGAFLAPGQTSELRLRLAADVAAGATQLTVSANGLVDGIMRPKVATLTLKVGPPGQTAVAGRFALTTGEPLEGVGVAIGAAQTTSDAAGNFMLSGPPTGSQTLGIDANRARAGLPIYAADIKVADGQVTVLATTWLTTPPPPERFVPITNATSDQVISDPRFPGVAFTLPAGVTITGWDGALKTKVAIERIAQDKLPVAPPPGYTRSLFQLFFGTPMGGVPSAPLPVTLPNDLGLEPGQKAELWYYDAAPVPGAAAAWRLAGLGTVSADGQRIASDPGVGIARFCGVCGLSCFIKNEDSQPSADEGTPEDGEPVNLAMGQHLVDAVDLLQPGRVPAVVYRTYNPFDAFGRIAGFELFLGQGWALSVDVALLDITTSLRRLVMPANARYEFARQSDGRFVNQTNPRFRNAAITDEGGGVQALRFSNGRVWRFRGGWIGRGRSQPIAGLSLLIEQRDRHDNALTISRDRSGGITTLTQSDGRTIEFTTSLLVPGDQTSARLTQVRDALGRTGHYAYEPASRRLQSVIDAAGGETRYAYDAEGRILSIRDQKGVTYVKNQYDAQGRVSAQEMADGGVWRYAYEGPVGAHTVVRVTNPRGHTTTYRMGTGGRGDEVIDALGQSMRVQRNAAGLPSVIGDALGRTTRIEYDAAQRPSASFDRQGNLWSFTYEPISRNVETITDPLGNATKFEYDAIGNLTARVNPEGDRLEFGYDGGGAPTTVTDALGRTTTYTYDAAGNVTSIRDPLGNTARFEHDAGSRLVKATDPNGAITRWFHDALNRVKQIVDSSGGVSTFTYDSKGNLLGVRDARGNTTTYTYDDMDRLRTRTDALGRAKTFAYDLRGNVVRTVDAKNQTTQYEYDALDRRIRTTHADGSIVEYFYDAIGRLIRTTDTDGGAILLTYDVQDRLTEEITAHGIVRYAYDVLGRRRSVTLDGGVGTTYDYDPNSRLKTLTQPGWGTATLDYFTTGQLQRRTLPNGFSTRYEYDDAGRVTRLVYERMAGLVLGDLTYGYDMAGRRTTMGGSLARTLLPDAVNASDYDVANQQLVFGNYTSTYDANGNATSLLGPNGLATLEWDARDRLRRVTLPDTTLAFGYDALARRTRRIAGDVVSAYHYGGGDVIRENRGGLDLSYLRGLGADETLGQERSTSYMIDGTRSTIGLVDDAGNVAQTFAYEPFGLAETSGSPDHVRYQFTGREHDADWLYYYRARYYSPRLARFLQPDPLGHAGGANPYAYAANNPLSFIDPSGLRTYSAHGCCQSAKSRQAWVAFADDLRSADPDVRVFRWSSRLFFDVIPSTKAPSDALLDQILRDLETQPLAPGEKLNLVGHSAGGIIINNVGNALRARGIPVDNLIMLGTPLYPGAINAAMPSDVPITNFDEKYDVLSTAKHGPNVTNIEVLHPNAEGTFDAATSHTGYMTNPAVINTIKRLIAK
jgi:RHS repeat-associated protein